MLPIPEIRRISLFRVWRTHPAQTQIPLRILLERLKTQRTTQSHHLVLYPHMAITLSFQNGFPANNAMLLPLRLPTVWVVHIPTTQFTRTEAGRDPIADWPLSCEPTRASRCLVLIIILAAFVFIDDSLSGIFLARSCGRLCVSCFRGRNLNAYLDARS